MNVQQVRLLLWYGAGLLALASIFTLAAAWLRPYDISPVTDDQPTKGTHLSQTLGKTLTELSAFEHLWALDLRRPLHDQPALVVARPTKRQAPALGARLAGTVVEPNHSVAMFITAGGEIKLKRIGQKIDEAQVLDITPDGVQVRYRGRSIRIALQPENQP